MGRKKGIDVSELPLIPICDEGRDAIDRHRAVAIKQFVERLKEEINTRTTHSREQDKNILFYIDNLVKEMVGEIDV